MPAGVQYCNITSNHNDELLHLQRIAEEQLPMGCRGT